MCDEKISQIYIYIITINKLTNENFDENERVRNLTNLIIKIASDFFKIMYVNFAMPI